MAFRINGFGADAREKKEMVSTYRKTGKPLFPGSPSFRSGFPEKVWL